MLTVNPEWSPEEMAERAKGIAITRALLHKSHKSSRPLSADHELIGVAGEFAFAHKTGLPVDDTPRPGGDKGIDFETRLGALDVKTARKAYFLIHEEGKPMRADVYVLAESYKHETDNSHLRIRFVGWAYQHELKLAPTKDFGHGITNHYIHWYKLRPMAELWRQLCVDPTPGGRDG